MHGSRAAIRNSGCEFPLRRITANLAPADIRKAGSTYDLPLAVALLQNSGQLGSVPSDAMFLGQLSFNGDLLHTDGVLPMVSAGIGLNDARGLLVCPNNVGSIHTAGEFAPLGLLGGPWPMYGVSRRLANLAEGSSLT